MEKEFIDQSYHLYHNAAFFIYFRERFTVLSMLLTHRWKISKNRWVILLFLIQFSAGFKVPVKYEDKRKQQKEEEKLLTIRVENNW